METPAPKAKKPRIKKERSVSEIHLNDHECENLFIV